jgi:RimJ/RimL family protein N-acetyltransferase
VADLEQRVARRGRRATLPALDPPVAAVHRRRGIGRALLTRAVDWARGTGVTKLELHVFPHNRPALALYEQFGFVREGYRRRHYRSGPEYVDAILMAYEVVPTLDR